MKKIYTILFLCVSYLPIHTQAQCTVIDVPLKNRVNEASLIVEAEIIEKKSFLNTEKNFVYTAYTLKVFKLFKGNLNASDKVVLIAEGGQVGNMMLEVHPNFESELGDIGVFLLKQNQYQIPENVAIYSEYMSIDRMLGWIQYDKENGKAFDLFSDYGAIKTSFYAILQKYTGPYYSEFNTFKLQTNNSAYRATPSITSFSPSSLSAGTESVLTIKGANFGNTRGSGKVEFKNPDDGGTTLIPALKNDFISWSDTMIVVKVRSKAGTGTIKVTENGNASVVSSGTLTVTFANLNIVRGDTSGFISRHNSMNGSGGITWRFNNQFWDSTKAVNSYMRAIEKWRCGTYVNWDTIGTLTTVDKVLQDNLCIVTWDTDQALGSSTLGVCYTFWSGCFNVGKGDFDWFVKELDIVFKKSANWNFGPNATSGGKTDFESVALHELGHGHQLGHVIKTNEIMHFAIGPNTDKRILSLGDLTGGTWVMDKSKSTICGTNGMTLLDTNQCALKPTTAKFVVNKANPCLNETVTFTDSSSGNISSWSWNFGANATPATANGKGPHNVQYSTGGTKNISLSIVTSAGNKNFNNNITVKSDAVASANFSYTTGLQNLINFVNTSTGGNLTYKWHFGDNDSSTSVSPTHQYSNSGSYGVILYAGNGCNLAMKYDTVSFVNAYFKTNKTSACIKDTVVYSDSSEAGISSYSWSFGAGASPNSANGAGPHKVVYNTAGAKNVTVILSKGSITQPAARNAIVNIIGAERTTASFTSAHVGNNTIVFTNTSSGTLNQYKWYFGDGDSSTTANPSKTYASPNAYTVTLVSSNICNSDDTTVSMPNFVSVENITLSQNLTISPNPFKSIVYYSLSDNIAVSQNMQVEIADISGKVLITQSIVSQNGSLDLSVLSEGYYLIKIIENGNLVGFGKILKME